MPPISFGNHFGALVGSCAGDQFVVSNATTEVLADGKVIGLLEFGVLTRRFSLLLGSGYGTFFDLGRGEKKAKHDALLIAQGWAAALDAAGDEK